ncbi:MAG: TlpA family protein disulfide reductase [Clostridiales bacterium]|nr:TlpA family protein disulfide reductase [Clostridiales bacterium]
MPDLVNINQEEDVVVLAVNVREDKKTVTDYMDEHQYDFEVILDEDGSFASEFYVASFPTSFFIDEEGILLGSVPGMVTAEMLDEIILKIRNDELE